MVICWFSLTSVVGLGLLLNQRFSALVWAFRQGPLSGVMYCNLLILAECLSSLGGESGSQGLILALIFFFLFFLRGVCKHICMYV